MKKKLDRMTQNLKELKWSRPRKRPRAQRRKFSRRQWALTLFLLAAAGIVLAVWLRPRPVAVQLPVVEVEPVAREGVII
ncbi:MAG: hypothetical protein K2H81_04880 [Alistipes sp.]|nr:hypothetical protein [Alistipes sp.]